MNFRRNPLFNLSLNGGPPSPDSFYFRLVNTNLYYTQTKYDMIVISSLTIRGFKETAFNCIKVLGQNHLSWDLCSQTNQEKQNFLCALYKSVGKECPNPQINENSTQNYKNSKEKLFEVQTIVENQPIWLFMTPSPTCNQDWNYKNYGLDWKCQCSDGFYQSPIKINRYYPNIRYITTPAIFDFPSIKVKYLSLYLASNTLKLVCDDHKTSSCNEMIMASIYDYDGTEYIAYEMVFHSPSEHQIGDEKYDMEVQIIFKGVSEGDYRKKAGLSILLKQTAGAQNIFFKKINPLNFPVHNNQRINIGAINSFQELSLGDIFNKNEEKVGVDMKKINYFSYSGSLTSPPCDEPVKWFVVETPIEIGLADFETVKRSVILGLEVEKNDLEDIEGWKDQDEENNLKGNLRKIQPMKGRTIEYYNKDQIANMNYLRKRVV